jgi:hypothetical protein
VALALAHKTGIAVPESCVEIIYGKPVLLLRRFGLGRKSGVTRAGQMTNNCPLQLSG